MKICTDWGEKLKLLMQDKHVLFASHELIPFFAHFANYLESDLVLSDFTFHQRKKFMHDMKKLLWDEAYLYRNCADRVICRVVPEVEMLSVLEACHSSPMGGHH